MKLTNRQLDVLINTIYKKAEDKKTKKIESRAFQTELNKLKRKYKFPELYVEQQEILAEKAQYEELKRKWNKRLEKFQDKVHDAGYTCGWVPSDYRLENVLINKVSENIKLPSKQDIEAQIILASMGGCDDIITEVCKSLGI